MSRRSLARTGAQTGTDQQRLTAVLDALTQHGVAHWFDLRGTTGVREDRYDDYTRSGVERRVGEHIGSTDSGGGFWGDDGRLYAGQKRGKHVAYRQMWWSFNHEHPDLAELLVRLFLEAGFEARWSGDPGESVIVDLGGA